ncbi:MAG TPA: CoA transferase [Anaerolineae bacterium]|nr:CoA transferase [Anaerolineae bacterium]
MNRSDPPRESGPPPLVGKRVLDLSPLFPGPYCSRILADLGAEVIKIEQPGRGDWARFVPPLQDGESLLFRLLNQGKKSLTLNLKDAEAHAIFLSLIKTADVLIETFRPGVMERLGLGAEVLAEANPRLVQCSLTGYGTQGSHRDRAGHDLNFVGLSGMLDVARRPGGKPCFPGTQIADITGGLWAAIGILAALMQTQDAERGLRVESSLLGTTLASMPFALANQMGGQPRGIERDLLTGGAVCYQLYACKDGGWISMAALEPEFWSAFCDAVGRRDLLDAQFAPAAAGEGAYDEFCALFQQRTRAEWMEIMEEVDCCCEPVYSLGEALESAPVQALDLKPDRGMMPPIRLNADPPAAQGAAPKLGEHTDVILASLGVEAQQIEALRQRQAI